MSRYFPLWVALTGSSAAAGILLWMLSASLTERVRGLLSSGDPGEPVQDRQIPLNERDQGDGQGATVNSIRLKE